MGRPGLSDAPQELIDEIIDYCSRDKKTLIACSLTCRGWVRRTRRHLFSKLTLTDKTLPVWCGIVVTPRTTGSILNLRPFFESSHPYPSPSSAPSSLSSYIKSLQLVPTYSPTPNNLGAHDLLQAKSHLSAFPHLKSLTLAAISFISFNDTSLKACFGSLAETVRELKLAMCVLDEHRFAPFLRVFNRLESLEVDGNVWYRTLVGPMPNPLQEDAPTVRGLFVASGFTQENDGLLDYLSTTKLEYHTITVGHNHHLKKFDVLFAKCKNHLKKLTLTAPEWPSGYDPFSVGSEDQVLNISPCEELVEIQARFNHADFRGVIPILKTVASSRFRKLTLFLTPPNPATKNDSWTRLDEGVAALAERVDATVNDTLEVLFSSYQTALSELVLSDIQRAFPRIASDARVSLRVKNIPVPLDC